ncbi:MAG: diguanylate cyclase [Gammaproteobacteria bacterium]|nr:diguanylate cyclase [Gammaproteobacteria bacterium]
MTLIEGNLDAVVNEHIYHAAMVEKMIFHARERSLLLHQLAVTDDPFEQEKIKDAFYVHGGEFIKARDSILGSAPTEDENAILRQQSELTKKVVSMQYRAIELSESGLLAESRRLLFNDLIPLQNKVITLLRQFIDLQDFHNKEALDASAQAYSQTVLIVSFSIIVVMGVGVFLVYYILRRFAVISERMNRQDEKLSITNNVLSQNITELNEVTDRLQKSEQQERAIRENMLDAVVTINKYGIIESCNPATEKMFGYTADELLGQNVSILMPESLRDDHDAYLGSYRASGQSENMGMARNQYGMRKDGSTFSLDIGISQMKLEDEIKVVGIMRDITDRVEAEKIMLRSKEELEELVKFRTTELEDANQQLMHLARHDSLTGLANRAFLEESLKVAIAYANRNNKIVAFMFIDLDGFKKVNDDLGHDVGDLLLIRVANKLKGFVRAEDCVSRMGGDEFVVMLFGLDNEENVSVIAKRIIDDFSEPMDINGHSISIGVSIGISLFPQDADNCKDLIKCADQAMYQVKKSGKNNYNFCSRKVES